MMSIQCMPWADHWGVGIMGGKGDFGKRKEAGEGASQLCSEERYVGVQSEVVR